MVELPDGTVTFLFTDVVGSTRLWEDEREAMDLAMERHDEILTGAVQAHGGHVVKHRGDGIHAVFASALDAVLAAASAQAELSEVEVASLPLGVRMGLHSGEAIERDEDYYGSTVNRAARLSEASHGGQILLSLATEELVSDHLPNGWELRDLGRRVLRDLSAPEQIFQLDAPGLESSFPAPRTLDTAPNNLPRLLTEFIGRDSEIRELTRLMDTYRVVTITGPGGVGKSRLALQVGASATETHPDGVWLVDLAPLRDPSLIPHAFASAVGVADQPRLTPLQAITTYLSGKDLLAIVDNCEHLVDDIADFLVSTLQESGLNVLATSQEPLDIDGETVMRLAPLPVSGPTGGVEASELFEMRARAADSSFAMDEGEAEAVARICQQLDGVPLAIELAAAQVSVMTPQQIADRLDQRFRLLAGRRRGGDPRHHTLLDTVQWSYSLLDGTEQSAFGRLSVFVGGFTLDAAEAVGKGEDLGEPDVLPVLTSLVRKSLITPESGASAPRFRILETLRQFGLTRLSDSGDAETRLTMHADYFTSLSEDARRGLVGPDAAAWIARLEEDLDNLRASMEWLVHTGEFNRAAQMVDGLYQFWATSHHSEGAGWVAELLEVRDRLDSSMEVAMLSVAARFAWLEGEQAEAHRLAEAGLDLTSTSGAEPDLASLATMGISAVYNNQPERGLPLIEQALEGARRNNDQWFEEQYLDFVGMAKSSAGDDAGAIAALEESLAMSHRNGHETQFARTLVVLTGALRYTDLERSLAVGDEAVELTERLGLTWLHATVVMHRGLTKVRARDHRGALGDLGHACRLTLETRDFRAFASTVEGLALELGRLEWSEEAVMFYAAGDRLRQQLGEVAGSPQEIRSRKKAVGDLADLLGDEEFNRAWQAGLDLDPEAVASLGQEAAARALDRVT